MEGQKHHHHHDYMKAKTKCMFTSVVVSFGLMQWEDWEGGMKSLNSGRANHPRENDTRIRWPIKDVNCVLTKLIIFRSTPLWDTGLDFREGWILQDQIFVVHWDFKINQSF